MSLGHGAISERALAETSGETPLSGTLSATLGAVTMAATGMKRGEGDAAATLVAPIARMPHSVDEIGAPSFIGHFR
jgi:hypothetical protein